MNTKHDANWLEILPLTGYNIQVLLQNGQYFTVPYGRISCDGVKMHISMINAPEDRNSYPTIGLTIQVEIEKLLRICFKDEFKETRSLKHPNWQIIEIPRADIILARKHGEGIMTQLIKRPIRLSRKTIPI